MTTQPAPQLHLPTDKTLADYLLDPGNRFEAHASMAANSNGTTRLDSSVRFTRRGGGEAVSVDVRADGSVWLTHFGARWWRVIFDSPGNRRSAAHVPTPVILAAIRAAIGEE